AVREDDPGKSAFAGVEEDGGHGLAPELDRAVRGAHAEARVGERATQGVAAAELGGVDVGAAAHLLRQAEPSRRCDVGGQGERPYLPALLAAVLEGERVSVGRPGGMERRGGRGRELD